MKKCKRQQIAAKKNLNTSMIFVVNENEWKLNENVMNETN